MVRLMSRGSYLTVPWTVAACAAGDDAELDASDDKAGHGRHEPRGVA